MMANAFFAEMPENLKFSRLFEPFRKMHMPHAIFLSFIHFYTVKTRVLIAYLFRGFFYFDSAESFLLMRFWRCNH